MLRAVHDARGEDHGGDLVGAVHPAGLVALGDDDVDAGGLGGEGLFHVPHDVQDGDPRVLHALGVELGVAPRLGDDLDPLFKEHVDVAVGDVGEDEDGEVGAEGPIGEFLGPPDMPPHVLGAVFERGPAGVGGDHAEAAGVGDGGGKLAVPRDGHAAFENGVVDAENLGDASLPHALSVLSLDSGGKPKTWRL